MRRLLVFGLLLGVAMPAAATTVLKVGLAELVDGARSIVVGEVVAVEEQRLEEAGGRRPYTYVTVRVDERWKGEATEQLHTIRLLGGSTEGGGRLWIPGIPTFAVGEHVVLFDREDGSGCPLVGLGQGVFRYEPEQPGGLLFQDRTPLEAIRDGALILALPPGPPAPHATLGRVRTDGVSPPPDPGLPAHDAPAQPPSAAAPSAPGPATARPGLAELRRAVAARLAAIPGAR